MSTRANIIVKDSYSQQIFYRHSDGYPKGTLPTLNIFLTWVKDGKIRNNVSQGAGWLIVIGAIEYNTIPKYSVETIERPKDWKCGAYELTDSIHGDIDYLYTVDLEKMEIKVQEAIYNHKTGKQSFIASMQTV